MVTAALQEVAKPEKSGDETQTRLERAEAIVNKYVKIAAGAGLVPVPIWDIAAVFGSHLALVKDLAEVYGASFSEGRAKSIVSSLVGGVGAPVLGHSVVGSLVKAIPGVGTIGGVAAVPALAAASAYATGKVFTAHFEAGGSLASFDPDALGDFYREKFHEGKEATKNAFKKASDNQADARVSKSAPAAADEKPKPARNTPAKTASSGTKTAGAKSKGGKS